MKTLSKIKLNQFSKAELEQRSLNILRGGRNCGCSCSGGCGCPCDCSDWGGQAEQAMSNNYTPMRADRSVDTDFSNARDSGNVPTAY